VIVVMTPLRVPGRWPHWGRVTGDPALVALITEQHGAVTAGGNC